MVSEAIAAPPARHPVAGWIVWPFRLLLTLTAVLVLLQPVSAGLFVTGDVNLLGMHSATAIFVALLCIALVVLGLLVWRPGRGPSWPLWLSVGMLLLVVAQTGFGFARQLELHFPLGVLLFGYTLLFTHKAWRRIERTPSR